MLHACFLADLPALGYRCYHLSIPGDASTWNPPPPQEVIQIENEHLRLRFDPQSGWLTSLVGLELGVEQEDVLDVGARELVVDGRRIGLTPLEFGVMRYLYQREGEVVTRISLLEDVWGYDYTGGSNVVDARMASLRKKLGQRAAMIETVPGTGYRFRRV